MRMHGPIGHVGMVVLLCLAGSAEATQEEPLPSPSPAVAATPIPISSPGVAVTQDAPPQPAADVPEPPKGPPPFVRKVNLSEPDVASAILRGTALKGRIAGLRLEDAGRAFMNAMAALGGNQNSSPQTTGFAVELYTPLAWIQQQASFAAKQYRTFTFDDVSEDMLRPVLRILVHPDKPMDSRSSGSASSVEHVVVRDEAKKRVIQPLLKEPFSTELQNAFGAKYSFDGLTAEFDLEDVQTLINTPGQDEFFVTAIGEGSAEKNFKVKIKHFEKLPGLVPPRRR
ncbi:MAG: hypothetical protein AB7O37_21025 [Vicinamibacteria bacterium]